MRTRMVHEGVWIQGTGRTAIDVRVLDTGNGLIVTLLGGCTPHVGAVSCSPPLSTVTFPGHKDDTLSSPVSQELAQRLQIPVVVTAGVHLDGISKDEIISIVALIPDIIDDVARWYNKLRLG